jgi:tetratricopeptide (TPR) repeat protein
MQDAAAWIAAIAAVIAGLYAAKQYRLQRIESRRRSNEADFVRLFNARNVDPARFVGAYAVRTTRYLPVSLDGEIAAALESGSDILLTGRGGIGKSHSAVYHIREFARQHWLQRWKLLVPDRNALQQRSTISVNHRRHIILFDDLDEYLSTSDLHDLMSTIASIRDQSKSVRIVATLRSTTPQVDVIEFATKLLSRLKIFRLPDWSEEQRDRLAVYTQVPAEKWDGTPLSAKQPSEEMKAVFEALPPLERSILGIVKALDKAGLHYCHRDIIYLIAEATEKATKVDCKHALETISRRGFLKRNDEYAQVYGPYLEMVSAEAETNYLSHLREVLIASKFYREMYIVAKKKFYDGENEEARVLFYELARLDPEAGGARYRLAMTYWRDKNWPKAIEWLEEALKLSPDYLSTLFRLAAAYTKAGNASAAERVYARARKVQLSLPPPSMVAEAEALLDQGDSEGALRVIDAALLTNAEVLHGWGVKGQIHLRRKEWKLAKDAFAKALIHAPGPFVYFGLGQVARTEKQWGEAEEYFRKSIELSAHPAPMYSLLGQALMQQGKIPEAIVAFQAAMDGGAEGGAHFGLGVLYHKQKDWVNAAYHLQCSAAIDPTSDRAYSYLGDALMGLKEFSQGLTAYRTSVRINPNSKFMRYNYAAGLALVGRVEEAMNELNRCLDLDPEFPPAERLRKRLVRESMH